MNSVVKLIIATVLAGVAGVSNLVWLNMKANQEYVTVISDLRRGDKITKDDLGTVPIPGDASELSKTFVPEGEQAILFDRVISRDYQAGDPVLHRDLVASLPKFEVLGPFRLVSVGDRVRIGSTSNYEDGRDGNSVTVAVSRHGGRYNDITERLLEVINAGSRRDSSARIVALQLYPRGHRDGNESSAAAASDGGEIEEFGDSSSDGDAAGFGNVADSWGDSESYDEEDFGEYEDAFDDSGPEIFLKSNERAIIVPLNGVESVPEVLVRGDKVGFVVPASN